jgi:hypothetical protein
MDTVRSRKVTLSTPIIDTIAISGPVSSSYILIVVVHAQIHFAVYSIRLILISMNSIPRNRHFERKDFRAFT